MRKYSSKPLKLIELFNLRAGSWSLAWTIGALTLIAMVGLLATSGWFISAAAIAGLVTGATAISFDFFRPSALIRAFAIIRTAGRYGERMVSHHAVLGLLKDLRCRFFAAITKTKISHTIAIINSEQIMHRLTTDIEQLDELPLRVWAPWLWAQLLIIAFLFWLWLTAPTLLVPITLLLTIAGLLIPVSGYIIGIQLAYRQSQIAEQRRQHLLQPLRAITALLLWQQWRHFAKRFITSDQNYHLLEKRQQSLISLLIALQQSALAGTILWLLYQGFPLIEASVLSVPMLLALILAVFGFYEFIPPLSSGFMALGLALTSRQRLNTILAKNVAPTQTKTYPDLPLQSLRLNVQQLYVKHNNAIQGANNIEFSLCSGEVLFITGASGSGKSTLLSALAGELTPQSGRITINERPLSDWDTRHHLGYLTQQIDIFDLTLAENLRFGNSKADEKLLWQVLEDVRLAEWAKTQPQQLNTLLGEYGAAISGGQARRIALARLLLSPKSILLLDEPFAGLDSDTANQVLNSLKIRMRNGILIIVTHQNQYIGESKCLSI